MSLAVILPLISALPKVIAAAPEFINLFNAFVDGFSEPEQEQLKSAYQAARDRSDSAEDDFVAASQGD